VVDLDREQDIEELRRIAQAQQAQIRILLDALAIKSKEIDTLKGKKGDLQLTLKMLEALQAKAKAADEALAKAEAAQNEKQRAQRKPRTTTGPTEQPNLPIIDQEYFLDDADRTCPSCGGGLSPMKGQYDESEMIDVVEVNYRLVMTRAHHDLRCSARRVTARRNDRAGHRRGHARGRVDAGARHPAAAAAEVARRGTTNRRLRCTALVTNQRSTPGALQSRSASSRESRTRARERQDGRGEA
jgi:hypothetical protein